MADVGQGNWEEVNFQPAASTGGENYGWKVMEGNHCFDGSVSINPPCFDASFVAPVHEYRHISSPNGGFSITGGYAYRGPIASLQGVYFFADFVSEQIWSFRYDGERRTEFTNRTAQLAPQISSIDSISSFGEDARGNLYIVDLGGEVFKIVSRVQVTLGAGFNLISFPIDLNPARNSGDLLAQLGSAIVSISRVNPTTQQIEATRFVEGVAQGVSFPLVAREGYSILMREPATLTWTGTPASGVIDLLAGVNLIGFSPPLLEQTAFQVLLAIGSETVSSIQRLNLETGRFETAAFHNGQPAGINFPIVTGQGYFVSTKQPVAGFVLAGPN